MPRISQNSPPQKQLPAILGRQFLHMKEVLNHRAFPSLDVVDYRGKARLVRQPDRRRERLAVMDRPALLVRLNADRDEAMQRDIKRSNAYRALVTAAAARGILVYLVLPKVRQGWVPGMNGDSPVWFLAFDQIPNEAWGDWLVEAAEAADTEPADLPQAA